MLRTIRTGNAERFEVPRLGLVTADKRSAIDAIRTPKFELDTGLSERTLIARYLAADLNCSGKLSFTELESFQKKILREFTYISNEYALDPEEFLEAGGGDCEDFALYTAGLLRFWGWEPYIASFASTKSSSGHAVCFSYEEGTFPKGYTYYDLDNYSTSDGTLLKAGRYVPIDYDIVGGLSNAVDKGWKLRAVYIPEKIWGLEM